MYTHTHTHTHTHTQMRRTMLCYEPTRRHVIIGPYLNPEHACALQYALQYALLHTCAYVKHISAFPQAALDHHEGKHRTKGLCFPS
jgi:hypothetical protein